MRILAIILFMAVNLAIAIALQTMMTSFWWVEFLLLLASGPFLLALFFGLWVDAEWSYPYATILFALSLANILWLHTIVGHFQLFGAGLFVNIAGIISSFTRPAQMHDSIPSNEPSLETYDVENERKTAKAAKKTAKKRKKTKKKRGRPRKKP